MSSKKPNPAKEKIKNELAELLKNKKTVLAASIKNIPSSQFQEIVKKLRGKALVKVPKKSLIFRALDSSENETLKKLKDSIQENTALLFSDIDAFELAGELANNRSPVKAKAGQESVKDIEIPEGPTELLPGPAISELGALGIQIKIEKGKIHIKEPKIIVKEGGKISAAAADVMNKFNIKPFYVGFVPLAAFDTQEGKLYLDIKIDKEKTIEEIKQASSKALPFAVEIGYVSEDTICFLLRKAVAQKKGFEKFTEKVEDKPVDVEVKNSEGGEEVKDNLLVEGGGEEGGQKSNIPEQEKQNSEENK